MPVALAASGLNLLTLPVLSCARQRLDIKIDTLQIDAIRVGAVPGAGPSFGSIGIRNLTMHMEGDIQISTHP